MAKQFNAEVDRIKLERLGRRVVEARIYQRREAARKRRILDIVQRHLHASAAELQERLNEAFNMEHNPPTEEEVQAVLNSMNV